MSKEAKYSTNMETDKETNIQSDKQKDEQKDGQTEKIVIKSAIEHNNNSLM